MGQRVHDRPVRGLAGRQGRPAGARDADDARERRRPRRGQLPASGTPRSGSSPARATASTSTSARAAPASRPPPSATRETQRRSYPRLRGQFGTRGWEFVEELDLEAHAARVGAESRELLTAPECPSGETDLILGGEQLALQIHESVGHAIELDRILGWEAAYAGTSWLDLAQLGSLQYGSELMNITIDPTIPGALGSLRLRRRGHARDQARRRARRASGSACWPVATPPPSPASTTPAACAPTAGRGCRWCG